jgi:RimJ/RimL family protein N-acetyltransferase
MQKATYPAMNFKQITEEYYARFLGMDPEAFTQSRMVCFRSNERNVPQPGYSKQFDIYLWIQENRSILSYGDQAADRIDNLISRISLGMNPARLGAILEESFSIEPVHSHKYVFIEPVENKTDAIKLGKADFNPYLTFFMETHPDCTDSSWLEEYFIEIVQKECCFGIFEKEKLVCATDAAEMPYMQGVVQEIGINTLAEYRKKGYAQAACTACIQSLLEREICPIWSTGFDNIGSQKLAFSLGFEKLADVFTISL